MNSQKISVTTSSKALFFQSSKFRVDENLLSRITDVFHAWTLCVLKRTPHNRLKALINHTLSAKRVGRMFHSKKGKILLLQISRTTQSGGSWWISQFFMLRCWRGVGNLKFVRTGCHKPFKFGVHSAAQELTKTPKPISKVLWPWRAARRFELYKNSRKTLLSLCNSSRNFLPTASNQCRLNNLTSFHLKRFIKKIICRLMNIYKEWNVNAR